MRPCHLATLAGYLLLSACSPDKAADSQSSTGMDTTTSAGPGTSATASTSEVGPTTGAIECVPVPDEGSSSSGDTGGTGEPPEPIAAWQDYVMAECTALVKCGCAAAQQLGKDLATCVATRSAELGALAANGHLWDPICAAARVAGIQRQCQLETVACEATECELFKGMDVLEEPCQVISGSTQQPDASNCREGVVCKWNVCLQPCKGEFPCDAEICNPDEHCLDSDDGNSYCYQDAGPGERCDEQFFGPRCADGLVCAPYEGEFDNFRCVQPGESCQPCATACGSGHYCDEATKLCWPGVEGAPCTTSENCQSLACPWEHCSAPPGEGAACPQGVCAEGLLCGETARCYPIAQHGESCSGQYTCAKGLICTHAVVCEAPICDAL
ncbi:MAG: hypothetical protein IPO88_19505 [Nannocystis sp.]|uniref:hypothetical protein n=1 Tax=Nannocystis sp. TaxID=1962667 RepID=UPI0024292DC5|nr:hypothetical protein [Nannocystis sp.]MBK9755655.1 hypothetical protein [Nannocystis sp.]